MGNSHPAQPDNQQRLEDLREALDAIKSETGWGMGAAWALLAEGRYDEVQDRIVDFENLAAQEGIRELRKGFDLERRFQELEQREATEQALTRKRASLEADRILAKELRGQREAPRVHDGASFLFDREEEKLPLIGFGDQILWSAGEPIMFAAPTGVGKTTFAIQVVLRRLGLIEDKFLGHPVEQTDGKVLYIAADRPKQIRRLFRRCVTEDMAEALAQRLTVWQGPLPFDLGQAEPGEFVRWLRDFQVTDVVIDSLKDIAVGLTDDHVAAVVNRHFQEATAEGYEMISLHHVRKSQNGAKVNKLDDIYGSAWLTAGQGSVFYIDGKPESTNLELRHLKPPAEPVNLTVLVNRNRGTLQPASRKTDLVELVTMAERPMTAFEVAEEIHGEHPSKAQVQGVRNKLQREVNEGRVVALTDEQPYRYTGVQTK